MNKTIKLGRKTLIFFFLVHFLSCTTRCRHWQLSSIKAVYPGSTFTKAYLTPDDTFQSLGTEILSNGQALSLFLNTSSLYFPSAKNNDGMILVKILSDGWEISTQARCLEGGQRIQLSDDTTQKVFSLLLEGSSVIITVGNYQTVLIPNGFRRIYDKIFKASASL